MSVEYVIDADDVDELLRLARMLQPARRRTGASQWDLFRRRLPGRPYDLKVRCNGGNDRLRGRATIHARARKNLRRFNLDRGGLDLHSVKVDGGRAVERRRDLGNVHDH